MYRGLWCVGQSFRRKLKGEKFYHSSEGVFGYKPKPKRDFKIPDDVLLSRNQQSNIYRLVDAYRKYGHRIAAVDPVDFKKVKPSVDELRPEYYGLRETDSVATEGILNVPCNTTTISELQDILKQLYCGPVSTEFSYIESLEEREWLAFNFEALRYQNISASEKREIVELLIKSQAWDNFLGKKFPTVKRYGGEGAENMFAFFRKIFELAVEDDLEHIVLAMPHRGRGNLLTTMLNTRPAKFFRKFQGGSEFPNEATIAMGDVVSHYNASEELKIKDKTIRFSMLRNPSHLEAVNPVSMGKTRSKQQSLKDGAFSDDPNVKFSSKVLNIQLHGDAAFSGQGINQECLMMAEVPHFEIGGTIHMIVNNQVGFTTPGDRGRGTNYSSDLAKSIEAPVFHVNGDDPEALSLVTNLAFNYQRKFRKDVFIDLNCFRRWGHNELDDPTFTNPALYSVIHSRKSVPDLYTEKLIEEQIISKEEAESIRDKHTEYLNEELSSTSSYEPEPSYFQRQWSGFQLAPNAITYWDSGLDYSLLHHIGNTSVYYPKDFNIHPHLLKTHVEARLKKLQEGIKLDWATVEALAIGSLMYQGNNVRLSGEDVGRGTFSHRHAMLVDQKTNEMFIPLNTLEGGAGGMLEIANSILSEEAVLGYEYGMAIDNPNNLIIWEAQFGDFFNGAQIIIDTYIASGETKWMESNGLVMLLPHGYDGAASEHSSCRMERFLQLSDSKETAPDGDDVNVHIINPTTPAQYFHALRRQMLRNFRKPLVVVAPKILLRLPEATSTHSDMQPGTFFRNVIGDNLADPKKVTKIILCSGKHYYNLNNERKAKRIENTAIIRLESLCPFPLTELQEELGKYKSAKVFLWSQEEARNMGAWSFIRPRFEYLLGKQLKYYGRPEGPTPATGDGSRHRKEAEDVVVNPFNI